MTSIECSKCGAKLIHEKMDVAPEILAQRFCWRAKSTEGEEKRFLCPWCDLEDVYAKMQELIKKFGTSPILG